MRKKLHIPGGGLAGMAAGYYAAKIVFFPLNQMSVRSDLEKFKVVKLEKKVIKGAEKMVSFFRKFENLYLSGRNGLFQYTHIHDHMINGKQIIESIRTNG